MTLPPGASDVRRVGGGNINEAYRVVLADGQEAFVKTRKDVAPGEYAAEAAGLGWLAEPGALRTPRVLALDEEYLALEWIPSGAGRGLSAGGAEELGRGLAITHRAGAPCFGVRDGPGADASFGSLRLSNEPAGDWASFFAERRLLPLARIARDRGALAGAGVAAVEAVCGRLPELVGPGEPPRACTATCGRGT